MGDATLDGSLGVPQHEDSVFAVHAQIHYSAGLQRAPLLMV